MQKGCRNAPFAPSLAAAIFMCAPLEQCSSFPTRIQDRVQLLAQRASLARHFAEVSSVCKQPAPWPKADLGPGDPAQLYSSCRVAAGIQKQFGWHTFRHTHSPDNNTFCTC